MEVILVAERQLTVKQELFVQGLLAGLSQREAYKRAYNTANMKDNTIDVRACELAKSSKISVRLDALLSDVKERNMVTIERVLQEYSRLGFFDPRNLFNSDGSPKDIHELDDDTAAVVAGLDVVEIYEGTGRDRRFVGNIKKFKLADKKGALDSMAKYLGMFIDKHELSGPGGGALNIVSSIPRPGGD